MALTKKQLAARVSGIGASEIAALCGFSRWQKPIDVYLSKVNPPTDGKAPSLAAELGDLMEEPIAKLAADRMGVFLARVGTIQSEDFPFALATPDRAVFLTREARGDPRRKVTDLRELRECGAVVQCKHSQMRMRYEWGESGTDHVPDYFYPQGIWECGVSLTRRVTFAVLFDKHDFGLFPIDYRADLFTSFYEVAERFMVDHVLAQKPPPPDASDKYAAFLNSRHGISNGTLINPSTEIEAQIFKWAKLKVVEKRAHELAAQIGNELKAQLGDNYGYQGDRFGKVLWLRPKPSTKTDWKAVAADLFPLLPKLAEASDPALRESLLAAAAELVAKHTIAFQKAPSLNPYFGTKTEAAQLKSQPVALQLDAGEGVKEGEEEEAAA